MESFIGRRFGRFTVIEVAPSKNSHRYWVCRCDCGEIRTVREFKLVSGGHKSCGCLRSDVTKARSTIHGMAKTHPMYGVWLTMRRRCNDPLNHKYQAYGARGIKVCERWSNFSNFAEDMLQGWRKGLSIERIDNEGDYTPENCRWATAKEQARNRRSNVRVVLDGVEMVLKDACALRDIDQATVRRRMKAGWPEQDWFSPPRR